jgi:hypothetical protein
MERVLDAKEKNAQASREGGGRKKGAKFNLISR